MSPARLHYLPLVGLGPHAISVYRLLSSLSCDVV